MKLAVSIAATWVLVLISGFVYPDQASRYDDMRFVAVLRQVAYETPFQPLYLVVAFFPVYVAAARNVPWLGLAAGGILMTSSVLPYARFQDLDVADPSAPGGIIGVHSSLFQLAGPGHYMPSFVSIVTLVLMAGVVTMFWQPRVGGIIGLMAVISMAFVWRAALDNPPVLSGYPKIIFLSSSLLYGYYLAWLGSGLAVVGEWRGLARLGRIGRRLASGGGNAAGVSGR